MGAAIGYAYDARDNLAQVSDPRSLSTAYQLDGFDQLRVQQSPDTGSTQQRYDPSGQRDPAHRCPRPDGAAAV